MNKVSNAIKRAEAAICAAFLGAIIVLVFFAAILRQPFFGVSVTWNLDISYVLFAWVVFLGADLAYKHDAHIGMDLLVKLLPFGARKAVALFCFAVIAAFLAVIAVFGFNLVIENAERLYATLQISHSYAVASVPVGCSLMLFTTAVKARDAILAKDPAERPNVAAW